VYYHPSNKLDCKLFDSLGGIGSRYTVYSHDNFQYSTVEKFIGCIMFYLESYHMKFSCKPLKINILGNLHKEAYISAKIYLKFVPKLYILEFGKII